MISLEINGQQYSDWTSISVTRSLDIFPASFSFAATAPSELAGPFPIVKGDACRVLADGVPVITGFVERVNVRYNNAEHTVTLQGRDKCADVIDSTVGSATEINTPATLAQAVEQILQQNGITGIDVVDETPQVLAPLGEEDGVAGEIGNSVIEVIEAYCKKRQVLVTSNADGNLVLFQGSSGVSSVELICRPGDAQNNILGAEVDYNDSGRYSTYRVHSQGNASLLGGITGEADSQSLTTSAGEAIDDGVRATRVLNIVAETSDDDQTCQLRATWQANINRSRSFSYTATVQGHRPAEGEAYQLNTLIQVSDTLADIDGALLINSVTYNLTLTGGETTRIGCVRPDAYRLQASEPTQQQSGNSLGSLFGG